MCPTQDWQLPDAAAPRAIGGNGASQQAGRMETTAPCGSMAPSPKVNPLLEPPTLCCPQSNSGR